jgi:hypothetical protein
MTNKKSINSKSIVLSISLAIIAIAIAITIIIINGTGIEIVKAADLKTPLVASLKLNKVYVKTLKLDQKQLDRVNLVSNELKAEKGLNLVAGLTELQSNDKQLLPKSLNKLNRQLLVSKLDNSKSLLLKELNNEKHQLELVSLQSLLKLQPSLSRLG